MELINLSIPLPMHPPSRNANAMPFHILIGEFCQRKIIKPIPTRKLSKPKKTVASLKMLNAAPVFLIYAPVFSAPVS